MKVTRCRVCGGESLYEILDYGRIALANSFLVDPIEVSREITYPLVICLCQGCGHLQISEEVPPADLFTNYLYMTGVSDAVHQHGQSLLELITPLVPGNRRGTPFILEAASNDGTVLGIFSKAGWKTLGIDPAENIAAVANARGIETWPVFFTREIADQVVERFGRADVFLGRHVLAHVPALHDFVAGIREVIRPDGVAVIECPHVLPMHASLQYDQVYHEHLGYFSLTVLQRLFGMHGLELFTVREVGMHGGSLVSFVQRARGPRNRQDSVNRVMAREERSGILQRHSWATFAERVLEQREVLRKELGVLKNDGKHVAAYGASAKGQVLMQFCKLGREWIDFVADKSPLKQGRLTPGTHIPVVAAEEILTRRPDVLLLSAWNFADEIKWQQKEYLNRGGRLLHPLPMPHYI